VFTTILLTILSISILANLRLLYFISKYRRLELFTDFFKKGIFLKVFKKQRTPNTKESNALKVLSFKRKKQRSEEVKNVIIAEVRYVFVILILRMSKALFFKGANITKFLKRYTDQYDNI
jgi:hypothetical protein